MLDVTRLTMFSGMKVFQKGETIVSEGDRNGGLYIIARGEAVVLTGRGTPGEKPSAAVKEGGYFGELALFGEKPQAETAVALVDVIALKIDADNVCEFFTEQPDEALAVVKQLCRDFESRLAFRAVHETVPPPPKLTPPPKRAPAPNRTPAAAIKPPPAAQVSSQVSVNAPAKASAVKALNTLPENTPAPEKQTAVTEQTGAHPLFPEGHGAYHLSVGEADKDYVFEKTIICPMCGKSFKTLSVKSFKLSLVSTDSDMRAHYKDVDPLHYEIVTCTNCLYSSSASTFSKTTKTSLFINRNLAELKPRIAFKEGAERDTETVFLSFYLALTCAPLCEKNAQLTTGSLWMKLNRLYSDAEDEKMARFAAENALKDYKYAYENLDMNEGKSRQVCAMLGELCFKTGEYQLARKYFFKVKTDRDAPAVLKKHADDRLIDMKLD